MMKKLKKDLKRISDRARDELRPVMKREGNHVWFTNTEKLHKDFISSGHSISENNHYLCDPV